MTRDSTYEIARLEVSDPSLRSVAVGSEGVFQLTDVNWRLVFRDPKRGCRAGFCAANCRSSPWIDGAVVCPSPTIRARDSTAR